MDLYYEIAGSQIEGAREYQEDAFLTNYIDDEEAGPKAAALVIMADGMGGHAAGNIASNLVVSTFNQTFTGAFGKQDVSSILRDALIKANNGLSESIRETPALDGMGCTMVCGAFYRGKVWWVSVGDSHLYLIRDRELIKKNEDHSYGGYLDRMVAQGMEVEPEPGLSRNMLMSAMTGEDIAEIDCPADALPLLPGDRVIVASDGLDTLGTGTIIQMSAWSPTPKECVEALLKAVEDAAKPRQDNTTVVVVDVLSREGAEPQAPPPAPAPEEMSTEQDLAETQPLDLDAIETEPEPEPFEHIVHREADYGASRGKGGGRAALIVGAIAIGLTLAGGGYYLFSQGWFERSTRVVPVPTASVPEQPEAIVAERPEPANSGQPEAVASSPPEGVAPPEVTTSTQTSPGALPISASAAPVAVATAPTIPVPTSASGAVPPGGEFQDKLRSGSLAPVMVNLPDGIYKMGSSSASVAVDERPQHDVRVSAIAMSKYEVTIADYGHFVGSTGRSLPAGLRATDGDHPVTFVSWNDALAYTRWLSKETSKTYRLPTEAEWEYGARGGSTSSYWWGFEFKTRKAHCFDCDTGLDPRKPTSVGRFDPNGFGLYDTAGNVLEWTYDCYHANYDNAPNDGSVFEGGDCQWRVVRGGSFSSPSTSLRSTKRAKYKPSRGFDNIGFRIVRER